MTKRKDTKAKAFTCRGAAALITAALLTAAVLLTGCPQSIENKPNIPSGPDPNLRIEGGVLKGYNETPSGALVIPAGVTEIADSAFSGCTGLTQADFSQCTSLTKIGKYAFSGCTQAEVKLSESVQTIGNRAFGSAANLDFDIAESYCKKVKIPKGAQYERIKTLVKQSSYPEERIEAY